MTLDEVRLPFGAADAGAARCAATPADGAATPFEVEADGARARRRAADARRTGWTRRPSAGLYRVADRRADRRAREPARRSRSTFALRRSRAGASPSRAPSRYKWTDPVPGERYRPLEVTPAVSVRPRRSVLLFPGERAAARSRSS